MFVSVQKDDSGAVVKIAMIKVFCSLKYFFCSMNYTVLSVLLI